MTRSFNVFTLQDLTGNDYQTVVGNVHGELVKELREDVVVAILQFCNNKSSPVSIPDIKLEAKVFSMFTCRMGPNTTQGTTFDVYSLRDTKRNYKRTCLSQ
jgi:hypothetical protein